MNNEEKILAMLEKMNGTVEKHGELLEKLTDRVDQIQQAQQQMREEQQQMREEQQQMREEQQQMREEQQHMRDDITGIKLRLELDVEKRFDAVNEGIDAILAQLTPKRRVEEMEADITVLKAAVKMLTQEVGELKKAQ